MIVRFDMLELAFGTFRTSFLEADELDASVKSVDTEPDVSVLPLYCTVRGTGCELAHLWKQELQALGISEGLQ